MKIGVGAETKYRGNHFMKGAKWRALFCFIVALAAGCFAAACAEEHVHEYEAVVTPPTCTEQGYTTYTCPEDGESYVDDYVEPLGHTPAEAVKENVVDATCLGGGSYDLTIYCSVCGEELSRESVEVEKKDHTPETDGEKCSVCGTVLKAQEEIPASGHSWGEWTQTKAPTCTTAGEEQRVCNNDPTHVETRVISASAHTWVESAEAEYLVSAATCEEKAVYYKSCSVCGAKSEETFAYGELASHTPVTVPGKAATCTEAGLTEGSKCSVCGTVLKEQEEIPAKGHTPSEAKKENEKTATCTEAGSYDEVVYCSVCGEEISRKQVTVDKAAHIWVENAGEEYLVSAATCTAQAVYYKSCSACGTKSEETFAYGELASHTPVIVPGKAATCTETGLTDGEKCSVCGTVLKGTAKSAPSAVPS